jgi:hypothetical protein
MYELLLPSDQRKPKIKVGGCEFDPKKLGYVTTAPANMETKVSIALGATATKAATIPTKPGTAPDYCRPH